MDTLVKVLGIQKDMSVAKVTTLHGGVVLVEPAVIGQSSTAFCCKCIR